MDSVMLRDQFVSEIFSPSAKKDLSQAIHESYLILCQCAIEADVENAEDVAAVLEQQCAKPPSTPEKACMPWEWSPIPDSYTRSKLATSRLINEVGRCIDPSRIRGVVGNEKRLRSTFFEMRACCQMVRVIRNRNAHIDEYSNHKNQVIHEAYTLIRVYDLHSELVAYCRNGLIESGTLNVDDKASTNRMTHAVSVVESLKISSDKQQPEKAPASPSRGKNQSVDEISLESINKLISVEREQLENAFEQIISGALESSRDAQADVLSARLENILKQTSTRTVVNNGDIAVGDKPSLTVTEAENRLIQLRNKIREEFRSEDPSFEGYNNILQRPVVSAALRNQCVDFEEYKQVPKLTEMMKRNRWKFYKEQVERFRTSIDSILQRINYDKTTNPTDLDDDMPF